MRERVARYFSYFFATYVAAHPFLPQSSLYASENSNKANTDKSQPVFSGNITIKPEDLHIKQKLAEVTHRAALRKAGLLVEASNIVTTIPNYALITAQKNALALGIKLVTPPVAEAEQGKPASTDEAPNEPIKISEVPLASPEAGPTATPPQKLQKKIDKDVARITNGLDEVVQRPRAKRMIEKAVLASAVVKFPDPATGLANLTIESHVGTNPQVGPLGSGVKNPWQVKDITMLHYVENRGAEVATYIKSFPDGSLDASWKDADYLASLSEQANNYRKKKGKPVSLKSALGRKIAVLKKNDFITSCLVLEDFKAFKETIFDASKNEKLKKAIGASGFCRILHKTGPYAAEGFMSNPDKHNQALKIAGVGNGVRQEILKLRDEGQLMAAAQDLTKTKLDKVAAAQAPHQAGKYTSVIKVGQLQTMASYASGAHLPVKIKKQTSEGVLIASIR